MLCICVETVDMLRNKTLNSKESLISVLWMLKTY